MQPAIILHWGNERCFISYAKDEVKRVLSWVFNFSSIFQGISLSPPYSIKSRVPDKTAIAGLAAEVLVRHPGGFNDFVQELLPQLFGTYDFMLNRLALALSATKYRRLVLQRPMEAWVFSTRSEPCPLGTDHIRMGPALEIRLSPASAQKSMLKGEFLVTRFAGRKVEVVA